MKYLGIFLVIAGLLILIFRKQFTLQSYKWNHLGEFGVFGLKRFSDDLPGWENKNVRKFYSFITIVLGIGWILSGLILLLS
jgi:hypothetical protein